MSYMIFSFWFIVIHTVSYVFAGGLALKISNNLYKEKERIIDYVRDMSDESESKHVEKWFLPAQLVRGLLLSIVLYPIVGMLGEISFVMRFLFFSGLMILFTDVASAVPFPHNIEGMVYMKQKYIKKEAVGKLYFEIFIYGIVFGLLASWLLV